MDLLIDDIRDFNVDMIARNGEAGLFLLSFHVFDEVYFDHDLGHGMTGYTVLTKALEEGWLDQTKVMLVTSNPVGRDKMVCALDHHGFQEKVFNGSKFWVKSL